MYNTVCKLGVLPFIPLFGKKEEKRKGEVAFIKTTILIQHYLQMRLHFIYLSPFSYTIYLFCVQ